ncbi:MAG TPA: DUF3500 domain-containing protein [Chryseolinea sp.]|nr:DUF3500 domain-containing protein [Chryseolinea sp.]
MKITIVLLLMLTTQTMAQQNDLPAKANAFLATLSEPLKLKAQYKFDDEERFNWHFVPKSRNGVCFRDFNDAQSAAAMSLLKASLSAQGYEKTTAIISLENVLKVVENRGPDDKFRDPLNYYLTIFGTPGEKVWGWRFEGHHVALNFSSLNNTIGSSTPSFFGSNPGIVMEGKEKGKQVLKDEADKGFELVNAMSEVQMKSVLIDEKALNEIVSFNSRKALPLSPTGITYKDMNAEQQKMLMRLLDVYVNNYELGFSQKLREKIKKAGIDNLSFAWAGSLKPGAAFYYRIQGPMLLIELDNTQNNANHVHTVVRDLTNDFGEDILREHYEKEHQQNK